MPLSAIISCFIVVTYLGRSASSDFDEFAVDLGVLAIFDISRSVL